MGTAAVVALLRLRPIVVGIQGANTGPAKHLYAQDIYIRHAAVLVRSRTNKTGNNKTGVRVELFPSPS